MRRHLIFLILAALVALAVFAGGRANVAQALIALVDYVRDAGALGIAVFAAVYVVSARSPCCPAPRSRWPRASSTGPWWARSSSRR